MKGNLRIKRRAFCALAAALPFAAHAQDYPNRPIKLVVPFPAGGSLDVLGRQLASRIAPALLQPMVLESRAGANSQLGASTVARSAPDGYTLLLGTDAAFSIAPAMTPALPYQPQKDFAPLSMLAQYSFLLVAHPSAPADNVTQMLAYAKANPGKMVYASLGIGSPAHVTFEALSQRAGIEVLHVPYQGIAPALNALLAGEIQFLFAAITLPLPHIKAGNLKAIAYTGHARHPLLPAVPTFNESGLPGFEQRGWFGVFAPAATPQVVTQKLSKLFWDTASSRDFGESFLQQQGYEAPSVAPEQFGDFLEQDRKRWSRLVTQLGARLRT